MHLRIDPLAGSLNRTLGKGSYSKRVKEVVDMRKFFNKDCVRTRVIPFYN
jgi:hypothetical protein